MGFSPKMVPSAIRCRRLTASLFTLNDSSATSLPCHKLKLGESSRSMVPVRGNFNRFSGIWERWSGVAPDGSILTVRDVSSHEVYTFDLQLP